ncbi:MAG: lipoate--protein ligase family protein [Acidobacteria bacterium]|nr:lipoate--protein ligase family protein [Acidobacteriota bacterium]MBI3281253.1 lipoate--protein ligase family protein [Acidobacteriota bacterium]
MLRVLERSFPFPEDNLALDDRLLERGQEALRFWESAVPFVVLGRSRRAEEDVDLEACQAAGVPVLRRASGGGTVLQGPGCLNYALVLSLEARPELQNVASSFRLLLERTARALDVTGMEVCGSDILLDGRKVSGTAQRRTRGWLLHHGTFLYNPDMAMMERLLREPLRRPPHRGSRTHREFLTRAPLGAGDILRRIASAWA